MKKIKTTAKYISLLCLISCNSETKDQKSILVTTTPASIKGDYQVILRPLNNHLSGWIPNGKSEIKIDEQNMKLMSWLDDSSAVTHRQYILTGNRCPEARDDSNQDEVIDIIETIKASGKILIPLDDNLQVQMSPENQFPSGNFLYQQGTTLKALEQDLRRPDSDMNDQFVKLKNREIFNLENKVMIVLGLSERRPLPDSIQTFEGLSRQLSIPIVCGIIERKDNHLVFF